MKRRGQRSGWALAKGFLVALGLTAGGMLILAALVVFTGLNDTAIKVINQIIKAVAVFAGTLAAVGVGGERGLITGAAVGTVYSIAGYMMYVFLGGNEFLLTELLGEMLICVAAGSASGAVIANITPKVRHAHG